MPHLKKVTPIETMAMDVFFESVVQCCNRLSRMGDEGRLRSGVIAIRETVYNRLPGRLMAQFANRFLDEFSFETYEKSHSRIALEMIMDVEIVGLRLKGPTLSSGILRHLDLRDGRRFPKSVELDLSPIMMNHGQPMYRFLHTFHLNDLVRIDYSRFCTDRDLRTIGLNCPKLVSLEVISPDYVTDQGLRGLSPCSNLRVVHFRWAAKISYLGLNYLLSAHHRIEDFYHDYDREFKAPRADGDVDPSTGLDLSTPAPFMSRLLIESYQNDGPPLNLQAVVTKFPNLVHLKINCEDPINLSALKHLHKLTGLEVNFVNGFRTSHYSAIHSWRDIEEILSSIGSNITTLTVCARYQTCMCQQQHLNMIFHFCPNLEQLEFDHSFGPLVVPQFEKLKVLTPRVCYGVLQPDRSYKLELAKMPNLEVLALLYVEVVSETIKSIMFDDEKFPKLSVLKIMKRRFSENDLEEIARIARDQNLNFRVDDFEISGASDYPDSEDSSDSFETDDQGSSDWYDSDEGDDIIMEREGEVQ